MGLPLAFVGGLHKMLMHGLSTGVLAVLSIAGLLHRGRPVALRVLTDYLPAPPFLATPMRLQLSAAPHPCFSS